MNHATLLRQSDRLLAGFIALSQGLYYNARNQLSGVINESCS
jgi:hypothetical protein